MRPEQAKPVLDPLLLWGKWSAGRKCAEICGGQGGSPPPCVGWQENKYAKADGSNDPPALYSTYGIDAYISSRGFLPRYKNSIIELNSLISEDVPLMVPALR